MVTTNCFLSLKSTYPLSTLKVGDRSEYNNVNPRFFFQLSRLRNKLCPEKFSPSKSDVSESFPKKCPLSEEEMVESSGSKVLDKNNWQSSLRLLLNRYSPSTPPDIPIPPLYLLSESNAPMYEPSLIERFNRNIFVLLSPKLLVVPPKSLNGTINAPFLSREPK